jgi:peptide/nickel transport system substrate-binding protein
MQKDNPILADDAKVRQALLLALDRKSMVDKLFQGPRSRSRPPGSIRSSRTTAKTRRNIRTIRPRPRALLAEAGWKPGEDGICRNAAGDRLSLEFSTTAGNRLRELLQQVLQSQWKAASASKRRSRTSRRAPCSARR